MAKNLIIIGALAVALAAGMAWQTALKNAAELRGKSAQMQTQLETQQAELEALRQKLATDEAALAARQLGSQINVSALQQQLALAQAHVLEVQAKVSQAHAERERLEHVLQTSGEIQLNDQIHHDQVELKELDDQSRDSKIGEKNLKGEQNQALAQQKESHGEALSDIKSQVAQQQQAIKQTQSQISDWKKRRRDPDQANQLKSLGDQLEMQKGQLAALQNQVGLIKQDERIQAQVVKETTSREKSYAHSQQGTIEEQKKALKSDLEVLQKRKATNDRDQSGLKVQLQHAVDQERAAADQVREAQKSVTTLQIQVTNEQESLRRAPAK